MASPSTPAPHSPTAPRPVRQLPAQRLMAAAERLFPLEGIRAVGIERLISEAEVARASLYHAYGSKDGLVVAYLDRRDEVDRAAWHSAVARAEGPVARLLTLFDLAERGAPGRGFRGCLYLNAATEFPDRAHPVAQAVARHRGWLRGMLTEELRAAGVPEPAALAPVVELLYDGALAGSKFSGSTEPIALARERVRALLTAPPAGGPAV
ncbi:helix-turn-helix domain-containing protein [Streptomyces sp. DSM 44915]|uniref:Helix-turn-helix domain-containing protein n=1 Tax=Streptomyces chisholmiae TaxID=3075540 RepID=A0ABU2JVI8_9ACTN|nr:helix-turn-helix domain-containing protein [Streptomyces sp. DSM 44915]MDT0268991.1 helix-turn-helix domain-containing protein [Streptomyces sp. DSM 44915]